MSTPRESPTRDLPATRDLGLEGRTNVEDRSSDAERGWRRISLNLNETVPGTPYRLLRWLGDGGMGAVFKAQHVDTERHVAIKVLHLQRRSVPWVVEGFRNEARASARIQSPHIVDIYDFKELDDGRLLIAMELLDGPTLQEQIMRGELPWPRLVAIMRQVCKGLAAAHHADIVHRDVKPDNIIIIERGGRKDFVKLLDFGVAHFMRDGGQAPMSGTTQYMAPEAFEGTNDVRLDVYSVGCVLHALVVGEPPFESSTSPDTVERQCKEQPAPPSQRAGRNLPEGFDELVLRCLAKDPAERFQTMDEVEAALCELQLEHGWSTAWDDLPSPDVEEPRRSRIEAGLRALARPPRRGARWPATLLGGALVATAVAVIQWPAPAPAPTAVHDDAIAVHTLAAHQAAARFYFVYPPPEDPTRPTAYREVLALEAIDDAAARGRGTELRAEFAETLARLGDRYWGFEGARPFAYEYYASALVFAEHERARARSGLSPVALERLREHAATGAFTEYELLALEPLVALAEPDAETRTSRLEALRTKGSIPASMASSLDRILAAPEHTTHLAKAPAPEPVVANGDDTGSDTAADGGMEGEATPPESAEPVTRPVAKPASRPASTAERNETDARSRPRRDPAAARDLVLRAKAASGTGDRQTAQTLYNRALDADSRSVDALDGIADLQFRRAQYGECARSLERAVKLGPHDSERWVRLGDAYFKTLRYTEARVAYQRALELGSSTASSRLSKLERKLGDATAG